MTEQHGGNESSERETPGDSPVTFYRKVGVRSLLWRRSVRRVPGTEVEVRYPQVTSAL
jgi:hypothetical protein